jgi:hypothetical protein
MATESNILGSTTDAEENDECSPGKEDNPCVSIEWQETITFLSTQMMNLKISSTESDEEMAIESKYSTPQGSPRSSSSRNSHTDIGSSRVQSPESECRSEISHISCQNSVQSAGSGDRDELLSTHEGNSTHATSTTRQIRTGVKRRRDQPSDSRDSEELLSTRERNSAHNSSRSQQLCTGVKRRRDQSSDSRNKEELLSTRERNSAHKTSRSRQICTGVKRRRVQSSDSRDSEELLSTGERNSAHTTSRSRKLRTGVKRRRDQSSDSRDSEELLSTVERNSAHTTSDLGNCVRE